VVLSAITTWCTTEITDTMEGDFIDFMVEDEFSSVTLIVEDQRLYVHKEVLAAWSPVFRAMFLHSFKEKDQREIELPSKKVEDIIELLHCMYPPIHAIAGEYLILFSCSTCGHRYRELILGYRIIHDELLHFCHMVS
jgi:BTB/POZ domain